MFVATDGVRVCKQAAQNRAAMLPSTSERRAMRESGDVERTFMTSAYDDSHAYGKRGLGRSASKATGSPNVVKGFGAKGAEGDPKPQSGKGV